MIEDYHVIDMYIPDSINLYLYICNLDYGKASIKPVTERWNMKESILKAIWFGWGPQLHPDFQTCVCIDGTWTPATSHSGSK